jgi:tetrahydromethanopterin S-methyltransferase subunit A
VAIVGNIRSFIRKRVLGNGADGQWPFIPGRYRLFDATAPIVIAGSSADDLARNLAALETPGICMVATQCRSAADVEKLVRNIAANLSIQNVVVASESETDAPALSALLAVLGTDLELSADAKELLRKVRSRLEDVDLGPVTRKVRAVNMLGSADIDKVVARVSELASEANRPNTGFRTSGGKDDDGIERVLAASNIAYETQKDKAGNFYICVQGKKIVVEHFSPKNELLRVIEGQSARDLCITLIRNGWVSKLDHAAWLGRELLRAELAMHAGAQFVPDRTVTLQFDEEELTRH